MERELSPQVGEIERSRGRDHEHRVGLAQLQSQLKECEELRVEVDPLETFAELRFRQRSLPLQANQIRFASRTSRNAREEIGSRGIPNVSR